MPRRHRSARERGQPEPLTPPRGAVPMWARVEGVDVYLSTKGGSRCPGCNQMMRDGASHLVVIEEGDLAGRRHWHVECWRRELRRTGRGG